MTSMKTHLQKTLLTAATTALAAFAGPMPQARAAAIFGEDNRSEVTASSPFADLARATAIAVINGIEEVQPDGRLTVAADHSDRLCKDERFRNQGFLAPSCSGFLIGPDILLTAGHCQTNSGEEIRGETEMYCKVFDWLFDFQVLEDGEPQTRDIPMDRLYHCKRIIYAVSDERSPFRDFAIVQLDRPVTGRKPFKVATGAVAVGDSVAAIGNPMGLPTKVADRARVTFNNPLAMTFITNIDSYEGNSGSAVFNAKKEIVGILIGGTPSIGLVEDKANKCERLNRCDDNGQNCLLPDRDPKNFPGFQAIGTEVQRIAPVIEVLKAMEIPGF